ncbi:WD40-like Beta Propeller Repeat [bacterium JGI 053]|nr:WD40-like Beta Propeller Repeat [bacterium JGI 053]
MTSSLRRIAACAFAGAAAALAPAAAHAQIPSDEQIRVIDTPHFRVHYTPGLETLARRAGARAEEAYAAIAEVLVRPPRGRVDLLVADNVDYSNGFATPFPRNRIVLYAHPPVDDPTLAFYDDWTQLVITHELTHVFHLDYARGLPRIPRYVFGRLPLGFPETTTPDWEKEGLATYLESRLTRAGRVRGTIHEMQLRTAVLEGRFFSIDRASGDPASWPGGSTRYVYGSMFLQYLSERHGERAAGEFVRRYGGYVIPFLNDRAAREAYGVSFSRAWREWRASLEARYAAEADSLRRIGVTEPEVLTKAGYRAEFPRWSPDGRRIAYAAQTGREEAQQRLVDADGAERAIASRTTLAPASWSADGRSLVTSMVDLRDPYRAYSDLYRVRVDGGRARMTEGARLLQPDVARDGRIVALRAGGGTTVPVVVDASGAAPRDLAPPSLDVQWAYPRWSPDGTKIAISRWRQGGYYDVVILDAAGRVLAEATSDRAVDTAPAWSPDGRWVLFSSDRTGIANLYAYEVNGGRLMQVTNVLTGAFQPDVSPDGRWIAFQYYRSDGYHVARIPFTPDAWRPAPPVRPQVAPAGEQPDPGRAAAGPAHAYSALRSALPAYWEPEWVSSSAFGTAVGVATSGHDVVERHEWGASGAVYPADGRFEGGLAYVFRGLGNPALGASVFQDWSVPLRAAVGAPGGGAILDLLERERSASAVATFTRPRFRSFGWLSLGASLRDRELQWSDPALAPADFPLDRPPELGAIATLGVSTARAYDFSISTQDGFVAAASVEGRRATRPRDGETVHRGYTRVDGRAQIYRGFRGWGFARHVLALRAVGGADFGSATQYFAVGGTTGDGVAFPLSAGAALGGTRDLFVRGYDDATQFGDRAAAATAEWRFPIALVERGVGLVPVFLDRLWGTAFVDGGTAWCVQGCDPATAALFPKPEALVSTGAELGADLLLGFNARFRLRGGIALPLTTITTLTGTHERPPVKAYFTIGQSF